MSGVVDHGSAESGAHKRVTALATAIKLTTIYRAEHPRVISAAEQLLAVLRARPGVGPYVLHLRDAVFHGDDVEVPVATVPTRWLADRLRQARVRGVEIERDCAVGELLALAAFLQAARRDTTITPPTASDARLRIVPMVFRGHHAATGAPAAPASVPAAMAAAAGGAAAMSPLAQVRNAAECQQRLARIEGIAAAIAPATPREVDLVSIIGSLLPADVAASPELALDIVLRVLDGLEHDLQAVRTSGRRLAGGHLLQRAIEVARRYFPCAQASQPVAAKLPAGRPEDAAIQADLLALLDEYDDLPLDDRPLADVLAGTTGVRLDHEFLGILLHSCTKGKDGPVLVARLQQQLAAQAPHLPELLDTYLGPEAGERMTPTRRLLLVQMLIEAGHGRLVRERGYFAHELVVRGFPESLSLVASVMSGHADGIRLVRESLATMAPSLAGTLAQLPMHAGALAQPAVWRLLLAVDSEEAHLLLLAAATAHPLATRAELVPWLRTRALPEPEATVLRLFANPQSLPSTYVRGLYAACVKSRFDDALRATSGALLRQAIVESSLPPADLLAAVEHLGAVPGSETEQLLLRLARRGWLLHWGAQARALRHAASRSLARLRQGVRR